MTPTELFASATETPGDITIKTREQGWKPFRRPLRRSATGLDRVRDRLVSERSACKSLTPRLFRREHWIIRITPEAGTVKTNEAREVVLHPQLVDLGFRSSLHLRLKAISS